MKYALPEDLKKYVRKKRALIIVFYLAAAVILAAALAVIAKGTAEKPIEYTLLSMMMCAAILIAVMALIKHFFLRSINIFDGTYAGVVKCLKVYTRRVSESPEMPLARSMIGWRTKHTLKAEVEEPNGRIAWHNIVTVGNAAIDKIDSYVEGEYVFHLFATNVTVIIPKDRDACVQCAVCGEPNHIETDTCRKCSHTLIKSIDYLK